MGYTPAHSRSKSADSPVLAAAANSSGARWNRPFGPLASASNLTGR